MSDLLDTLPDFYVKPYSHLLHSLEKNDITVTDLLTLDPVEIARKCPLPLLDVRRLVADVIQAMQRDLKMLPTKQSTSSELLGPTSDGKPTSSGVATVPSYRVMAFVKTLDPAVDKLLGGGVATGYMTEIAGESAVGKTQFLLGLLLSVQLAPPQGLGKAAIYLSTEDKLNTTRLEQILNAHPIYQQLPATGRPSFDLVHTMAINNLEVQQQAIEFQLPIAVKQYNVGLVILDSVAANFRADHETTTTLGLVDRAADLTRLGALLRRIAVEDRVAVVVANQVSDRFAENVSNLSSDRLRSSSPVVSSTPASQASGISSSLLSERNAKMTLDHQQRFFTGWGDRPAIHTENLKTPALGLAWANQISARLVLKVEAEASHHSQTTPGKKRRRFMNVVFAPWTPSSLRPLEYSIESHGVVSVDDSSQVGENLDFLDESLWEDQDEEFP